MEISWPVKKNGSILKNSIRMRHCDEIHFTAYKYVISVYKLTTPVHALTVETEQNKGRE